MAGYGRRPSYPVKNFIDEQEEEALGGHLPVLYCSTIKSLVQNQF